MKAGTAGGIEAVVKAINTHIDNAGVCEYGCKALMSITEGNASLEKEVCEKEGLAVLLRVLREHTDNVYISEKCCGVIGVILSSPDTHPKCCTPEVIRAVEECYEKHEYSEKIEQALLSLKREEDPRVCDAVARSVCTKEAFQECSEECRCDYDENYYCPMCRVQQKVFRCLTCDKGKIRFYCEVCWQRDHQEHNGEEFFFPVSCATDYK